MTASKARSSDSANAQAPPSHGSIVVGRYVLYDRIASGGMAAVHLGRIVGASGFRRVVAIKRLHPHLAIDKKFVSMFLDEARVASRIQHPNVVGVMDVAELEGELFLVMDYVRGESLSTLLRGASARSEKVPLPIVSAILVGALYGLHAAHEARDESGGPMHVVHRDVSPHNVLVDLDGVIRVADFGIAKAVSRLDSTRDGEIKGKLAYMAPEQLKSGLVDRRTDVYAACVVLWEALVGAPLFGEKDAGSTVLAVMEGATTPPSAHRPEIPQALDAIVLRGLSRKREERFASALEMAELLVEIVRPAAPREVGAWVTRLGGAALRARLNRVTELEQEAPPSQRSTDSSAVMSLDRAHARREERRVITEAATAIGDLLADTDSPVDAISAPLPQRDVVDAPRFDAVTLALPRDAATPPTTETRAVGRPAVLASEDRAAGAGFGAEPYVERKPRRAWVYALAGSCIAIAIGGTMVVRHRERSKAPPVVSMASATSSPPPSAAASRASTPTPPTVLEPAPTPPPPATKPAPSAKRSPPHVRTVPIAHRADSATPRNDCDPPFTVDENGIKRFKRWCPQ